MTSSEAASPPVLAEVVDAKRPLPHGRPCASCGAPIDPDDRFCTACGAPGPAAAAHAEEQPLEQRHFRCQNCGSEVAVDLSQRSYTCAFCDSTYVVEFSPEVTGRQPPEFVIGFSVPPEEAQEVFRRWIREGNWFRPGDLSLAKLEDRLKGVYLPFWSFSMLAQSHWRASIGEHWYRTETYITRDAKGNTVTRTRRVQETEWWPLAGRHHAYYSGYLVSGSRGLSQSEADQIKPFHLPALKRYRPYFLAGWLAEEYSVARDQALGICQEQFRSLARSHIAAFLPGDTHRQLEAETAFSQVSSDLCLLPVYLFNYRYRGRPYRVLINGQTGRIVGEKPLSAVRIGVAVAVGAAVVAVIVLLILLLSR